MSEYFDDDERFARLMEEMKSWEGTPHVHHDACFKGRRGATNCARWADAVLVASGAIDPVKFPPYVTRNGGPGMLEVLLRTLDAVPKLNALWKKGQGQPPLPHRGRLIVLSSGRVIHHLAIIAQPPDVWHCLEAVEKGNYFDSNVRGHLVAVYAAYEPHAKP